MVQGFCRLTTKLRHSESNTMRNPFGETINPNAEPALPPATCSVATWQPIETAPKHGKRILLWSPTDDIEVGEWSTSVWTYGGGWINNENRSDTVILKPTHWMPLPMPPKRDVKDWTTTSRRTTKLPNAPGELPEKPT